MSQLALGPEPGSLTIRMVDGDPWAASLTLKQDGVAAPWPSAPVLEFTDRVWSSTLSEGGTKATWNRTETEVGEVLALGARHVRLAVGGLTWWSGSVSQRG